MNVDCPEKVKVCVSECTLRKWGTFYKDCLEDFSEEIKTTCVKECKALEGYVSSSDECKPLFWLVRQNAARRQVKATFTNAGRNMMRATQIHAWKNV